jgi:hypothetical protein
MKGRAALYVMPHCQLRSHSWALLGTDPLPPARYLSFSISGHGVGMKGRAELYVMPHCQLRSHSWALLGTEPLPPLRYPSFSVSGHCVGIKGRAALYVKPHAQVRSHSWALFGTVPLPPARYFSLYRQVGPLGCALVFPHGEASFGLLCDQISEVPIISKITKQSCGRFRCYYHLVNVISFTLLHSDPIVICLLCV